MLLDTLNGERFVDIAPAAVHATLLDESRYLSSLRTDRRGVLHILPIATRNNDIGAPQRRDEAISPNERRENRHRPEGRAR